jgi:hypothetical protein
MMKTALPFWTRTFYAELSPRRFKKHFMPFAHAGQHLMKS